MRLRRFRFQRLQTRLTAAYTLALITGLSIFATITFFTLHRLETQERDHELLTMGRAVAALIEMRRDRLFIEDTDRRQFRAIVGLQTEAAVLVGTHRYLLKTSADVPPMIDRPLTSSVPSLRSIAQKERLLRVATISLMHEGHLRGAVVVWRRFYPITHIEKLLFSATIFSVPLLVAIALWMGGKISRQALAPINDIIRSASEIEAHNLSHRLALSDDVSDEIYRLSVTINRMLDRLEGTFELQKRFTSDASHELRTPLAIILAEAELALRSTRQAEAYRASLTTISIVGKEMQQLVNVMLRAARAEIEYAEDAGTSDIVALTAFTISRMQKLAELRGIQLSFASPEQYLVQLSPFAFTQALLAILDNAMKYACPDGEVAVTLSENEGGLILTVRDNGPGFSADALVHALERFWRDDASRSTTGSGLGLFLANALLDAGGFRMLLSNDASGGAVVTIRFP
jgi:signal transduction histidine kinase